MAKYRATVSIKLQAVVPGYLAARRKELPEIFSFYATEDRASLKAAVHKLASSGHSYGLDRISEIAEKIEASSDAGDAAGVSAGLAELKDYIENLEILYE